MKDLFDEYLQEVHAAQAEGVLDDDLPEDYERWLERLDKEDIIKFANEAMNKHE